MSRVPIRLRVTLAFAGVMALVLVAIGLFLYLRLGAQLDESVDTALRSRATEISSLIRNAGGRLGASGTSPLIEQEESFAQVLTPGGRIVDSTPQLGGADVLTAATLERAATGPTFSEADGLPGIEGRARMLAVPVDAGGHERVVVVGSSLGDRDEALHSLATLLLIGGPIALLLASLAGYAVAGTALRPVESMRRRAAEISASDPGERLPVGEAEDELRRLGETLNAMLARLEEGLERERRFVDDASHELRTPLALHRIELELALRQARDAGELREAIASAIEEIDRLIVLADQLLVVARSEGGELTLETSAVDARELLADVAARFAPRARREGTEITVAPDGAGMLIDVDPPRVEQALTSLLDNALRHGRGPVVLRAARAGDAVELHVADSGPGIPAEFADRAFERFSRPNASRQGDGTGLGLAIVDTIARAHGGGAGLRNRDGGGLDAWLALPAFHDGFIAGS